MGLPHLHRITSGRGRPRLDSTAWVACTLQLLRARWLVAGVLAAIALAPAWWLESRPPAGAGGCLAALGIPWLAALLGESALLGVAALALGGGAPRPLAAVRHALQRLPVILAAIALRTAAILGILSLGVIAAQPLLGRGGDAWDYALLIVVAAVIIALGLSSALSQAAPIALCEGCGPIEALRRSVRRTRDLRMTVLKARLKLWLLLGLVHLALKEIPWEPLGGLADGLWEITAFAAGALLTAVSYLVLCARVRRQRLEVTAHEIAQAIP